MSTATEGPATFRAAHHSASVLISPADITSSMKSATTGGSSFEFFASPALGRALTHMMVGAMYGVGFGVLSGLTRSAE